MKGDVGHRIAAAKQVEPTTFWQSRHRAPLRLRLPMRGIARNQDG